MQSVEYQLNHLKLTGLRFGAQGKPLILALHGWLDNAASFIPLAAHFPDYQFVAIDMAGHGESQHRSLDAHYHLVDWVQDLHELICLNDWQDIILLGHSLGGIVGSLYSATFPEKVQKLILLESFGPLTEPEETSVAQLRKSVDSRIAIQHKTAKHPETLRQAVQARKVAGDLSVDSARLLVSRNLAEIDGKLQWRTDRRLRTISSLRQTEAQAQSFLQAIECPVLAVLGQEGFEKLKLNLQKRQSWVKKLTIAQTPGGHHLHMDYPFPVAQKIIDFLSV
ncbi:alpha/beta fold hydrolase [Neptunicella marina]|uniref:Alpha/beta hydrolase n=1 Tax=Neptunicella marina TaxID=2125989 RepID=A0A8J6IV27_9ALTE|nr:alpha/beta hydrolase [Neptunicella marina]MBC3767236.1 alpha/beta hydrolase [Neptunicella marina]